MEFLIRDMRESDWPRVSAIYGQALEEGKSTFQTEHPSYTEWNKNHLKDCRFVSVVEGEVVGFCAISATSKREVYRGVVEVSIYFDKKARENGLGSQLLDHLIHVCKEKGYWSLYSSIFSINEASVKLHKKCGFREIGYRERIAVDRFGNWQNTTLFEKRL